MNDEPIEEVYFNWLYNKVAFVRHPTPSLTFYCLLRELHRTEFVWFVSGDDNRARDGVDVRYEFLSSSFLAQEPYWFDIGCSVFEVLYAFAQRAEFQTSLTTKQWFWIFLENLNLSDLSDAKKEIKYKVFNVMESFIWRNYEPNGRGGLFPLNHPTEDQRRVEIWYQFCAYLNENNIS